MIPIAIMQLESIEAILRSNNTLTEEKKKQVDSFRDQLTRLSQGSTLGGFISFILVNYGIELGLFSASVIV